MPYAEATQATMDRAMDSLSSCHCPVVASKTSTASVRFVMFCGPLFSCLPPAKNAIGGAVGTSTATLHITPRPEAKSLGVNGGWESDDRCTTIVSCGKPPRPPISPRDHDQLLTN